MKPGIPWSVKGIGSDAREAAKDAARRRGMTLGAWLNTIILEQSETAEPNQQGRNLGSKSPADRDDTKARFDDLADQLAELSRQDQRATAGRHPEDARLSKEFTRILERLDATERDTVEAFAAVNDRLAGLGKEIAQSAEFLRPEDVPGYPALESALRSIIDHIAASETRSRDSLQAMQERLTDIGSRANPGLSEAALRNSATIARLEERLGEMATRIARAETAARQDLPAPMKAELVKLAERIDAVRADADSDLQRGLFTSSQATQREMREIREMESRMRASLAEARSAAQMPAGLGPEGQRIVAEMEALSQRIDDLKADAASERDLHSLRVALEQISARVAQGTDLRPLADMESRLAEISDRLERSAGKGRHAAPEIAELESRIAKLDQKLDRLVAERGELQAWPAIEPQLAALVERLGQTENQLTHLASLEHSIGQLFESVEQSRNWAREAAEEAANRMADRLSAIQPGAAGGLSPELKVLIEGLDAMRANSASVDQRNQETFAAIHDAVSQIVARLGEMEAAPAGSALQGLVAPRQPGLPPVDTAPLLRPLEQTPFEPPHIPPLDSFATQLSKPHVTALVTPLPDPQPQAEEARPPADDFIAAARRAAQAAHHTTGSFAGGMSFLNRGKAKPQKPTTEMGFSVPFLSKKQAPASPLADASQPPAGRETGKRRGLIVIGLVLLAAASALAFGTFLKTSKKAPPAPSVKASEAIPRSPEPRPAETLSRMVDAMLTAALPVPQEDVDHVDPGMTVELPAAIGTPSLRNAALNGNPLAQFIIAGRYLEGRGVTADPALAALWYQKSASQGLAPAQYRLGTLYERGNGVAPNIATALEWYERAAEGGNVKAMHNVAVIYVGAQAGTPGYQKAARWFEAAASYGLSDSQYNLAHLYERGLGVEKNLAQAMFWYGLAAQQNDREATTRANALAAELSPDILAKTQARIESFIPRPALDSANRVSVTEAGWQAPGPSAALN